MKPTHWIALCAVAFLAGACILVSSRPSPSASAMPPVPSATEASRGGSIAVPGTNNEEANRNYQQGEAAQEREDYDLAIAYYSEAIRLNPKHVTSCYNRFWSFYFRGQYQLAADDANSLLRIAPEQRVGWLSMRAIVNNELHDSNAAIRDCCDAIRLGDNRPITYLTRACAYHEKKEYDRVITDASRATRLDAGFLSWRVYLIRGKACNAKRQYEQAVADFSRVISLNPGHLETYFLRGFCFLQLGNFSAAVLDGQKALQIGDDIAAYALLTEAYEGLGNRAQATFHRQRLAALQQREANK